MNTVPGGRTALASLSFLKGGGEMGALIRNKNWKEHPLGAPETWPVSLRTVLGIMLHSRFPMFVFWGAESYCFYNDTYRPSLGSEDKHPRILGMPAREAWPEVWETIQPMIRQVLGGEGAPWKEDALIPIYRNGQIEDVYWTFCYTPIIGDDGAINGVLATCTETTEKVNFFRKIHARENIPVRADKILPPDLDLSSNRFTGHNGLKDWFFTMLADSMPQLVWTTDAHGVPDYLNRYIFEYSGIEAEAAMKNFWKAIMHPDDWKCSWEKWTQCLKDGHVYSMEHRFLRKDGIYRWQLSQAIPQRDEGGHIQMWVGTTTDIQEQKMFTQELERQVQERTREMKELNEELARSEARYHMMVNEIQDYAIFYLNKEGIIENWNKGAEKIKGYDASEIIGKHFSIFYTDQDKFIRLPAKLLGEATVAGQASHEGMRVKKDGSLFWAKVVITAIQDEGKKVIGFSKITHDLTDKKEAEEHLRSYAEQLEEKNKQLEKMNSELQSFAYISSHDLQEPLRKIQLFAARILDKEAENLSEKGRDYFHRMQQSANRMQTLIQDLLTYSRTTATDHSFMIRNFTDIFDEVKQELAETIREHQAVIEVIGEPCETRMIPFQMAQLLHNLLGNAIKFTKEGVKPHITISCNQVNGTDTGIKTLNAEKYCHIRIQDNGIGFEPQFSERIFEVFQRLHEKGEYTGTGIGLAIVKKIVENHSGAIVASGKPGEGARFDIYIPLR